MLVCPLHILSHAPRQNIALLSAPMTLLASLPVLKWALLCTRLSSKKAGKVFPFVKVGEKPGIISHLL